MRVDRNVRILLLLSMLAASGLSAQPALKLKPQGPKFYEPVREEKEILRNRVRIRNMVMTKKTPALISPEDLDFDRARRFRLDQKTAELITQLETLIKRPGQKGRVGELKMRLAELYYDRGQLQAAKEAERWETQVKAWEALSEADRARSARPILKTPRADVFRRKSLSIYRDLEKSSRSNDAGRNQQIRRDEVLYFLASTHRDLGEIEQAEPFYRELVDRFPRSPRLYAARLNLADLYFDRGELEKAIPLYLSVASSEGASKGDDVESIKGYALYKLGWAYMNSGTFDRSVLAFKRTIEAAESGKSERKIVIKREAMNDLARAYALSGKLTEAEEYFGQAGGAEGKEALAVFRSEAAAAARDQGRSGDALKYYDKLIAGNPNGPQARDYGVEKLRIVERSGNAVAYQKALDDFATRYGEGSAWVRAQPPESRDASAMEISALLRREAKNSHRVAQQKNDDKLFNVARGFYAVYFKHVPTPNAETAENLHEMRFYYAELLYRLNDFGNAARFYGVAGAGKFGPSAAYARILSLQKVAGASKTAGAASSELVAATQDFVNAYPQDPRVKELLYASAQEAFKGGDSKESVVTLRKVVENFSGDKTGVEAAERILFILEKEGQYDALVFEAQQFQQNDRLMKAGGPEFKERLANVQQKAAFKRAETTTDPANKARAFLGLSSSVTGDLQEKSLNNAIVFAREGKDRETELRAQQLLVKNFPKSNFAKDVYFRMGELAAREGKWAQAKKNYETYIRNFSKAGGKGDGKDIESARWNWLFIEAQIQEVWYPALNPRKAPSGELVNQLEAFVRDYPRSANRAKAIEILAFRRGVTLGDLRGLERMGLDGAAKRSVNDAEVVVQARTSTNAAGIVRANPPNAGRSDLMKEAVAKLAFELVEPKFRNYGKQSLNYSPQRFVPTLKGKLSALEDLEREYLRVVAYGNGDAALRSLERLSRLYRGLGQDIRKAPGVPKEDLAQFVDPLFNKSQSFLKTCFEKAAELKIGGVGLRACQITAAETEAEFANIGQERFPEPRYLPALSGDEAAQPLIVSAIESFKKGRFGEAGLALTIINERKDIEVTDSQRRVLENLEGLSLYRNGLNEAAVASFRKASVSSSGAVKAAALKNLAAVYLNVADFDQALDAITPIAAIDADSALMAGLGHKGVGEIAEAIDAYERGLQQAPNDALLNYNRSFALAASNLYLEASKAIQRYIELTSPPSNDVSRLLYRRWKGKASNEKLDDSDVM